MQGMTSQQQLQFHRLLNQAIAYAISCKALQTGFCGEITIHADAQFGLTVKTDFRTALSNEHKARKSLEQAGKQQQEIAV